MNNLKTVIAGLILLFSVQPVSAQRIELVPYPDAVPYSVNGIGRLFLSNTGAEVLLEHFISENKPDKVLEVHEGYFHGYRLCFTMGDESPEAESQDWIQILTIDADAALSYFEENSPEILSAPFTALKVPESGLKSDEIRTIAGQYRHLACRMYRRTLDFTGEETDEMSAVIQDCLLRIDTWDSGLYVNAGPGGFRKSGISSKCPDPYNEWLNCFDTIEKLGFVTLIEINGPALTPFGE